MTKPILLLRTNLILAALVLPFAFIFQNALLFFAAPFLLISLVIIWFNLRLSAVDQVRRVLGLRHSEIRKLKVVKANFNACFYWDFFESIRALRQDYTIELYKPWKVNQELYWALKYDSDFLWLSIPFEPWTQLFKIDKDKEAHLYVENWICLRSKAEPSDHFVIRLKYDPDPTSDCTLEVAAKDADTAMEMRDLVKKHAFENSIYRDRTISIDINFHKNRYSDDEPKAYFSILFNPVEKVADEDIIIDPKHHAILKESLVEFYQDREQLKTFGIPSRRAFLLYGPPGTGKSMTCRYVMQNLPGTTRIIVRGNQLQHIASICEVARLLQPSLLVLEDVDLAFSGREINFYGTVLGEFMDILDGMNQDDELLFLMTTNAIERVESAIKDRPGRVNQCLLLGFPEHDDRIKFLGLYLKDHLTTSLDLSEIAKNVGNVSQVFLKELCLRAVQYAAREVQFDHEKLLLENRHFDRAIDEIISQNDRYVEQIVGFRG